MMRATDAAARDAFMASRHPALVRAAYVLTGGQPEAEDLAQEVLVRVMLRWQRVQAAADPAAYTHRILVNTFLSSRRRRWHGELAHEQVPDRPGDEAYAHVDDRDVLRRALLALPPRQRAAVVLRHYVQLSEADTAAAMRCSVGTVKSLTSRGLAALRAGAPTTTTSEEEL